MKSKKKKEKKTPNQNCLKWALAKNAILIKMLIADPDLLNTKNENSARTQFQKATQKTVPYKYKRRRSAAPRQPGVFNR